jgi:N-acetylated-alpha-linked acidic dipeptidase
MPRCDVEDSRIHLREWSKLYSSTPHLAGDLTHATRMRDLWASIPTKLVRYDVLPNFPLSSSLSLLSINGEKTFEATLEKPALAEPTSDPRTGLPPFHGLSRSGSVAAELVSANLGTLAD